MTEAAVAPEIEAGAVDTSPAPETTPNPQVPEDNPQGGQPSAPEVPDHVAIYQDVVAKFNADPTYEMSSEESDAFLAVQDDVNSGRLEEPPLKTLNEEPQKDEGKPDEEKKEEGEPKDTENPEKSEKSDEAEPGSEENKGLTDSAYEATYNAMKKVGAKDVSELPDKIQSLIDNRDSSGGKLGSENKQLKQANEELLGKAQNHVAWLEGLSKGEPNAIKYLLEDIGFNPEYLSGKSPSQNTNQGSNTDVSAEYSLDFDDSEIVDEKLGGVVKGLAAQLKKANETIESLKKNDEKRSEETLTHQATQGWIDDVVSVVTSEEAQKIYGLSAKEARGLATQYFDKSKPGPVHPKFHKVHQLIKFANDEKMPNLQSAHVLFLHKNGVFAKKAVEEHKRGQASASYTPSVNTSLSEKQGRAGNNVPEPAITDDVMTKIEGGDFSAIPDHWMDDQGNLIPDKVPDRFRERAFGKAKPSRR